MSINEMTNEMFDTSDALVQPELAPAQATTTPDGPQVRAQRLLTVVIALWDDPKRDQCEETHAELIRLLESDAGLAPMVKHLRPGLYTSIATRLKESLQLLRSVPNHQAALFQLRQVINHLREVIGP